MIFPSLSHEKVLQVNDKTRLDASRSFVTSGETVTDIEIRPDALEAFVSVFNSDSDKWFLDWAYEVDGTKTVTVRITTDLSSKERSYDLDVLLIDDDSLFSADSDLIPYETDVLNYLPKGKNSYLYAHRKAQEIIIAYLDEQRIWNNDGSRITKEEIAAITDNDIRTQFNQWSTFQTLLIIFESIQVSNGDIFQEKKQEYQNMRDSARKRSALRLDLDKNSVLDDVPYDIRTLKMVRR